MKNHAIKTKKVDGYEIIEGVKPLSIDPRATQKAALPKILALPESAQLAAKQKEHGKNINEAAAARKRAEYAAEMMQTEGEKPVFDPGIPEHKEMRSDEFRDLKKLHKFQSDKEREEKKRRDLLGAAGVCNEECKALKAAVNEKSREILNKNPVFALPGDGEYIDRGLMIVGAGVNGEAVILSDSELEAIPVTDKDGKQTGERSLFLPDGQTVAGLVGVFMAKGEHEQVTVDGEIIPDYRGQSVWFKSAGEWMKLADIKLGASLSDTDILDADLTGEQRAEIAAQQEQNRIASLSDDERKAEYDTARAALAQEAQKMETTLKFDGDVDYQTKAQAFYDESLAELKLKYNIGD